MSAVEMQDEELRELIRRVPKDVLGTRIKEARSAAGFTHDYLGELCDGMYRQTLISYEKGKYRPSPTALRKIAEHTGRTVESFLGAEVVESSRPFPEGRDAR